MTETHEDTSKLTSQFRAARTVIRKGVYAPELGKSYMHTWKRVATADLKDIEPHAEWCVIDNPDMPQPESVQAGGMTRPLPEPQGMRRITAEEIAILQAALD